MIILAMQLLKTVVAAKEALVALAVLVELTFQIYLRTFLEILEVIEGALEEVLTIEAQI